MELPRATFARYLDVLGVDAGPPTYETLCRVVRAHLMRIPFENVSKLYAVNRLGLRRIPDLPAYLEGIENEGFGGTCYSNNPYLWSLLRRLGFDASLCGADMPSGPDVHIVIFVRVDGREYLVDVGYAAPFYAPLPRDLDADHEVAFGNERYVLEPQDGAGRSRLHHYRDGKLIHGYLAKPASRAPSHFTAVIEDSYRDTATFMNAVVLVRFRDGESVAIRDDALIHATPSSSTLEKLPTRDDLVAAVVRQFGIREETVREAIAGLGELRGVHG